MKHYEIWYTNGMMQEIQWDWDSNDLLNTMHYAAAKFTELMDGITAGATRMGNKRSEYWALMPVDINIRERLEDGSKKTILISLNGGLLWRFI